MELLPVSQASLCRAYELGVVEYGRALRLQNNLVAARAAGEIPDTILLLQHPSVFTIGVSGSEDQVASSTASRLGEDVPVFHIDRGGSITYHGPGQLVTYPIIDLRAKQVGIHQYVHDVEEVVIRTLGAFGITGSRDPKYPGVWVGPEKICALGIRVSHWVTKHGFALNVNTDLSYFGHITPCGIADKGVTSMARFLGHDVDLRTVVPGILEQCAQIFNMDVQGESPQQLNEYYAR